MRTEYVYDSNGDMQTIRENLYQLKRSWEVGFNPTTDILAANVKLTTFTYDCMHRQTSRILPGGETGYKSYDIYGRLLYELDFKEQATGYFYDALGRLEDKKYYAADASPAIQGNDNYPNTPAEVVHYTYDNLGRKLTETVTDYLTNPTTETYFAEYTYDDEGQLEWIHVQQGGQEYKLQYVYSPVTGRKTDTKVWKLNGANWVEDISTDYSYDELGRLYTVTADRRNNSDINEQTSYTYDLNGNRKSTTLPNGVYTEYSYNTLNRLTDLVHYQTTQKLTTLSSFNYKMNAQGMRTGATEVLDETRYLKYDYDNLNRLENEYSDNKANNNIGDTTPPPPSDIRGYKSNYVYDLLGNRQSRTVTVRNDSGQQNLVTSCDYYSGTDKLWHEYTQGPELAFQWGGGSVYAYANPNGGRSYQLSDMTGRIGSFTAFALGLPTEWNRWVLISLMILLPIIYFAPVFVQQWRRLKGSVDRQGPPDLKLWHRCLCLLFSYIFLIGPECFQMLAYADTQYSQLSPGSWGSGNRTIEYQYDANGSVVEKRTYVTGELNPQINYKELISYEYNLQNRLSKATTTQYVTGSSQPMQNIASYKYNPDGIRIYKWTSNGETDYIIDPYNHTGYAQVLEEIIKPLIYTINSETRVQYTIGDDIISQTHSSVTGSWVSGQWTVSPTQFFLHDGHGSTRQLVTADLTNQSSYSYDGYGVLLRDEDSFPSQIMGPPLPGGSGEGLFGPATNYLYCGEQYDGNLGQYYLRARYYDPMNGRFTQMDPYSGDNEDPQSLHKYLYCNADPVNNIDPSGMFTLPELSISMAINTIMRGMTIYNFGKTFWKIKNEGLGALTFFDWLFLGLDVLHITSALTWLKMTSVWQKQAKLFHNLGEKLAKAVGRSIGGYTGQLGTRMHEALKASWIGKAVKFAERQLSAYGVEIFIDQAIGTGIGGRPDITIVLRKLKIGIAFDMKAVPKAVFYSGILPSYQWLYEQTGSIKNQREGAIKILDQEYGVNCLYFYIPYPSFVL